MRSAAKILMAAIGSLTLVSCSKSQQAPANQDQAADQNISTGQLPPDAEIETLPADESSVTPSAELQNGDRAPDDNNVGNSG